MTMNHSALWGALGSFTLSFYANVAAAQCADDTDCGTIESCKTETYDETCEWVAEICGGDTQCVQDMACTPAVQEWSYCQRLTCEADADCGADFRCEIQMYEDCRLCEGADCSNLEPGYDCKTVTYGECRYRFERNSCTEDAECGDGFTCEQTTYDYEICDYGAAGAAGAAAVGSGGGAPIEPGSGVAGPPVALGSGGSSGVLAVDDAAMGGSGAAMPIASGGAASVALPGSCRTQTSSYSYCQLKETACDSDSDCPAYLECHNNTAANCYIATSGDVVCENPQAPAKVCEPEAWGDSPLLSEEEHAQLYGVYNEETGCHDYPSGDRECPDAHYYADGTYYSYVDGVLYDVDGTPLDMGWGYTTDIDLMGDDSSSLGTGGMPGATPTSAPDTQGSGATGPAVAMGSGGASAGPAPRDDNDDTAASADSDMTAAGEEDGAPSGDAADEDESSGGLGHGHDNWGWGRGLGGGCSFSSAVPNSSPGLLVGGLFAASFMIRRRRRQAR